MSSSETGGPSGRRVKIVRRRLADGRVKTYTYNPSAHTGRKATAENPPAVRHLSTLWKQSPEWARLAASTKWHYDLALSRIQDELGWMRLSDIDSRIAKPKFYKLRDSLADRPGTADYTMAVLSSLLTWAARRNLIDVNRARDIPRLSETDTRAEIVLEAHDEPRVLAQAKPEFRQVIEAALLTGLRESDLCRLHHSMIGPDGWLTITPLKTKRHKIVVTLPPSIVRRIHQGGEGFLLARPDGKPWTPKTIQHAWAAVRTACALPHLHFHDLRGTLTERLFEAGCTDAEAAALTGKRIGKGSLKAYVRRTRTLTLNALAKLEKVVLLAPEKENRKTRA